MNCPGRYPKLYKRLNTLFIDEVFMAKNAIDEVTHEEKIKANKILDEKKVVMRKDISELGKLSQIRRNQKNKIIPIQVLL
jgi:hypothetical protein